MKHVLLFGLPLVFLAFSFSAAAQTDKQKVKVKENKTVIKGNMNAANKMYPYTAMYSSKFVKGNDKYASMVLQAWKGYDDNNFDGMGAMFADTVKVILADGTFIQGKDNAMKGIKDYRGSFADAKSVVHAWMPVRSVDRNEDWVLIWGDETDRKADGTTLTSGLHEAWQFNKDGKVVYIRQFAQAMPKK